MLNLAYGTQNDQSYLVDPLAYAAEVAWHNGIVVVTAAGNGGSAADGRLTNPPINPYVLAVGASEAHGSGTSQSAAVTAGAAALLLDVRRALLGNPVNADKADQTWPTSSGTGTLEGSGA